jgi:hypothetical protein
MRTAQRLSGSPRRKPSRSTSSPRASGLRVQESGKAGERAGLTPLRTAVGADMTSPKSAASRDNDRFDAVKCAGACVLYVCALSLSNTQDAIS